MDLSEQCGYTVEAQCKLFHSIKPLFNGKPTLLVMNKIDVTRLEDLHPDSRALVQEIIDSEGVQSIQVSCYSEEGVMDLKNAACDALLAARVENKLKGSKINTIINRIHVAQPKARDDVVRAPHIPEAVKGRKKYDKNDPERRKLQRDIELEEGGAGVYNMNMKEHYLLANPEWKMDIIPEIMDGKNIADFIDPDIAEKLEALEREEEKLEAEGFYESDEDDIPDSDSELLASQAQDALQHKIHSQSIKKSKKNQSRLPRTAGLRTLSEMSTALTKAGLDPSRITERAQMLAKAAGVKRKRSGEEDGDVDMESADGDEGEGEDSWMDVDGDEAPKLKRTKGNSGTAVAPVENRRAPKTNRQLMGMRDEGQASRAIKLRNFGQRPRNYQAKAGEADRAIKTKMPKHLFAGKRKGGKTDRR